MNRTILIWGAFIVAVLVTLACSAPALPLFAPAETTPTPRPTRTPRPTFTVTPTETPVPTDTPKPTNTPVPPTATPAPPTDTPVPPPPTATFTRRPPTATFTPAPPPPTPTPAEEFTGTEVDIRSTYKCGVTSAILVAVVDRNGKPMAGYHVHIGKDGPWSKWIPYPTTNTLKEQGNGFAYNAEFNTGPTNPYYITIFRQEEENFNIANKISNEVRIHIDEKDVDACSASEGNNTGGRILVAAVRFVYNR